MSYYNVTILEKVKDFLNNIVIQERGKIYAYLEIMKTGDFIGLDVKTIKSPLKELRFKKYRLLFLIHKDTIYIIALFIKKKLKNHQRTN